MEIYVNASFFLLSLALYFIKGEKSLPEFKIFRFKAAKGFKETCCEGSFLYLGAFTVGYADNVCIPSLRFIIIWQARQVTYTMRVNVLQSLHSSHYQSYRLQSRISRMIHPIDSCINHPVCQYLDKIFRVVQTLAAELNPSTFFVPNEKEKRLKMIEIKKRECDDEQKHK